MDPFSSNSSSSQTQTAGPTGGFQTDIKPIDQPVGKRPKAKSSIATFMGSEAAPGPASSNFGGKTLMGQ